MAQINDFYGKSVDYEWKRLVKDTFHRLEFDTTLRYLRKYLPPSGKVLDAGGGPGRYTVELVKMGYQVTLLDITPQLLEKARKNIARLKLRNQIDQIVEGSIVDLGQFANESFDAVLCLGGPLSHVSSEVDRKKAVNELARVAKRNSPIFISVMGRLGVLIKMLKYWPEELAITEHFRRLWEEGDDDMWRREYYCHFFLPDEFVDLIGSTGVEVVEKVGLEGLAHFKEDTSKVSRKFPQAWQNWLEAHSQLNHHPAVFATSDHMLIVGKKR